MKREELITQLLDNMNVAKRSLLSRMQAIMQDCPVSPAQLELLGTIFHLQPISSKELAAHLQLSPGAISQLADGLEQHGFIKREAQSSDRRIQYLSISAKGSELLERISKPRHKLMEQLMEQLTDEELAVWLRIQQKMIAQFQVPESPKQTSTGDNQ